MDSHPVTLVRTWSSAALVLAIAAMLVSVLLGVGPRGAAWAWTIFGVAIAGAAAQLAASAIWRRGLEASWDEQVQRSNLASHAFGYWITLAVFLALLAAAVAGLISPATAFYWIGTPLAAAPPLWMLAAFLRGRAG